MSDNIKVMHLSYLVGEQEEPEIGDKVTTLCGLTKKLKKPSSRPVCGECFKIFSEDAARTGAGLELCLYTLEGIVERMNLGRDGYSALVKDKNVIITGEIYTPKKKEKH